MQKITPIELIRRQIAGEIFDYSQLMSALSHGRAGLKVATGMILHGIHLGSECVSRGIIKGFTNITRNINGSYR